MEDDEKLVKLNDVGKEELFLNIKKNYFRHILLSLLFVSIIVLAIIIVIYILKGKNEKKEKKENNKDCEP